MSKRPLQHNCYLFTRFFYADTLEFYSNIPMATL